LTYIILRYASFGVVFGREPAGDEAEGGGDGEKRETRNAEREERRKKREVMRERERERRRNTEGYSAAVENRYTYYRDRWRERTHSVCTSMFGIIEKAFVLSIPMAHG